jgi:hypothetical protein
VINSIITYKQTVERYGNGYYFHITKNARYLLHKQGSIIFDIVKLYEYDFNSSLYTYSHSFNALSLVMNLFVSEDASLVVFNTVSYSPTESSAIVFFKCDVDYCETCLNMA